MTLAQVLQDIQTWIVANGNNEITADILRPILEDMVNQPNTITGALGDLSTTDKTTLAAAINEVLNVANNAGGVIIHIGTDNPNNTPPASFALGDFYQQTLNAATVAFYIFNGNNWVLLEKKSLAVFQNYKSFHGNYTVVVDDYTLVYSSVATGGHTLTLPAAGSNSGRILKLVNRNANSLALSATVLGIGTLDLNALASHSYTEIQSNGFNWQQIGR